MLQHISARSLAAFGAVLLLSPAAAFADTPAVALASEDIYRHSLKALTVLLVVAVLIENALNVLFHWRVFLTYFNLRGIKTIIAVAVSALIVQQFNIDVVASLVDTYSSEKVESSFVSIALTALIVSGGSSGVNTLMVSLGYRDAKRAESVNPEAPEDQAWIAVKVNRRRAVGPVQVLVTEVENSPSPPNAIAGSIGVSRPGILELLLRNSNRFPANGGYVVEPGKVYTIEVSAFDSGNKKLDDPLAGKEYRFAPRAVVDFEVTL